MCNHDEVIHTAISADGNERVRVLYDFDPIQPNGDCYGTIYHRESRNYADASVLCHAYRVEPPDINWYALHKWCDGEEQIAAILRGEQSICDCGANVWATDDGWSAADFDPTEYFDGLGGPCAHDEPMFDYRDDGIVSVAYGCSGLIAVVTEKDLEIWGASREDITPNYAAPLEDFEAWASGEVFCLIREERVKVETRTTDSKGQVWLDTSEDWREVDSCGGYYGDEYAIKEAESWVK